jgi:hypothetical protein
VQVQQDLQINDEEEDGHDSIISSQVPPAPQVIQDPLIPVPQVHDGQSVPQPNQFLNIIQPVPGHFLSSDAELDTIQVTSQVSVQDFLSELNEDEYGLYDTPPESASVQVAQAVQQPTPTVLGPIPIPIPVQPVIPIQQSLQGIHVSSDATGAPPIVTTGPVQQQVPPGHQLIATVNGDMLLTDDMARA